MNLKKYLPISISLSSILIAASFLTSTALDFNTGISSQSTEETIRPEIDIEVSPSSAQVEYIEDPTNVYFKTAMTRSYILNIAKDLNYGLSSKAIEQILQDYHELTIDSIPKILKSIDEHRDQELTFIQMAKIIGDIDNDTRSLTPEELKKILSTPQEEILVVNHRSAAQILQAIDNAGEDENYVNMVRLKLNLYEAGITDPEEALKRFELHSKFWNKTINSSEFKENAKKWSSLQDEAKKEILQQIADNYLKYNKINGFNRELKYYKYFCSDAEYDEKEKSISINSDIALGANGADLISIVASLAHEFVHAHDDYLKNNNSIYSELYKSNLLNYRGAESGYKLYANQPIEILSYLITFAVYTNDFRAPDKLMREGIFFNNSYYTETNTENLYLATAVLQNKKLREKFFNDGVLDIDELTKAIPDGNKYSNKIFTASKESFQAFMSDLQKKDFSKSHISGVSISQKKFNDSKFYEMTIENSKFYACDFSNVDFSKIKEIQTSLLLQCIITDTPENKRFVEENSKYFIDTEWRCQPEEKIKDVMGQLSKLEAGEEEETTIRGKDFKSLKL